MKVILHVELSYHYRSYEEYILRINQILIIIKMLKQKIM